MPGKNRSRGTLRGTCQARLSQGRGTLRGTRLAWHDGSPRWEWNSGQEVSLRPTTRRASQQNRQTTTLYKHWRSMKDNRQKKPSRWHEGMISRGKPCLIVRGNPTLSRANTAAGACWLPVQTHDDLLRGFYAVRGLSRLVSQEVAGSSAFVQFVSFLKQSAASRLNNGGDKAVK